MFYYKPTAIGSILLQGSCIGSRLRAARISKGVSGHAVAEQAGIHWSTIYRYENGVLDNPRYNAIFRLAVALDVSPYWLLGSSTTPCSDPERNDFIQRFLTTEAETTKPVSKR
jgi:transcriptional regulator with XRE-family HTH domain